MLARRSSGTVGSSKVDRLDASGQSHEERSSGPRTQGSRLSLTGNESYLEFETPLRRHASPARVDSLGLFVFFDLKPRREEAWLIERFSAYGAYRARTRRLIPWLH